MENAGWRGGVACGAQEKLGQSGPPGECASWTRAEIRVPHDGWRVHRAGVDCGPRRENPALSAADWIDAEGIPELHVKREGRAQHDAASAWMKPEWKPEEEIEPR